MRPRFLPRVLPFPRMMVHEQRAMVLLDLDGGGRRRPGIFELILNEFEMNRGRDLSFGGLGCGSFHIIEQVRALAGLVPDRAPLLLARDPAVAEHQVYLFSVLTVFAVLIAVVAVVMNVLRLPVLLFLQAFDLLV